jgi:Cytochrome c554 and c-prime
VSRLGAVRRHLHPTSRKGAVGLVLAGIGGVALAAVLAVGAVAGISWAYGTYGYHPAENAQSWAALTPQYGLSSTCQSCHAPEYAKWDTAKHASVDCGTCHGPLAEHAATATANAAEVGTSAVAIQPPTADLCVLCHEQVPGRPSGFPVVELSAHYGGAPCLGCHDSHAATAVRPPDISHELANLPACITCHKPAGLKPLPIGHEEAADSVCQTCHKRPTAAQ